jgi:hypothetical protein
LIRFATDPKRDAKDRSERGLFARRNQMETSGTVIAAFADAAELSTKKLAPGFEMKI